MRGVRRLYPMDLVRAREVKPKPVESVSYAPGVKATFTAPGEPKPLLDWGRGGDGDDLMESLVRQLVEVTIRQEEERLALELEAELDRLQREQPRIYAEVLKRYALLRAYVEANRDALAADDPYGEL